MNAQHEDGFCPVCGSCEDSHVCKAEFSGDWPDEDAHDRADRLAREASGNTCKHGRYDKGYCADCEVVALNAQLAEYEHTNKVQAKEIVRLREALRKIKDGTWNVGGGDLSSRAFASTALKAKPAGRGKRERAKVSSRV